MFWFYLKTLYTKIVDFYVLCWNIFINISTKLEIQIYLIKIYRALSHLELALPRVWLYLTTSFNNAKIVHLN